MNLLACLFKTKVDVLRNLTIFLKGRTMELGSMLRSTSYKFSVFKNALQCLLKFFIMLGVVTVKHWSPCTQKRLRS